MDSDFNKLTKTYLWNTFSKVSQDTALLMRMRCNHTDGNTTITMRQDGSKIVDVFYHNNLICSFDDSNYDNCKVKLYNKGYFTKTTKERLNAILYLHTNDTVRIKVVRGKWLLCDSKTDTEINFYEGIVVFQKPITLSEVSNDTQMEVEWAV